MRTRSNIHESIHTDGDDDEATMEAQQAAEAEVYGKWHGAVMRVAEDLFERHGLELVGAHGDEDYPFEYRVTPSDSWPAAAEKIMQTINGVGMFQFDSLREFLRSGPWTAREAVLLHLGTIKDYPEVYGSSSPQRQYEAAF